MSGRDFYTALALNSPRFVKHLGEDQNTPGSLWSICQAPPASAVGGDLSQEEVQSSSDTGAASPKQELRAQEQ